MWFVAEARVERPFRLFAVFAIALLGGCPTLEVPKDGLRVLGTLDRESVGSSSDEPVAVEYASEGARAEWWPCDLRLTALGCVGDHHVNVYVALPDKTSLDAVGRGDCVTGDIAAGVFEMMRAKGGRGEYAIGSEVSAFILVASDKDDVPGVKLDDDEETVAATRLVGGVLRVDRWAGAEGGLGLVMDATTAEGREVQVTFGGAARSTSVVPVEDPSSCVESALVRE